MNDTPKDISGYREASRGCLGATPEEWFAGYTGPFATGRPIFGTFVMPEEGEPMLAKFTDGKKWSGIMAVQRLLPGLYVNLVCGTTFEWADDLVVVYSALSRQGEPWKIVREGEQGWA
jgi:hypothetical protein